MREPNLTLARTRNKDFFLPGVIITTFFLFFLGLAYTQFLKDLKLTCNSQDKVQNDLDYHIKKANRSISPRRPDFNRLYQSYCKEKYGERNGSKMFEQLNEIVNSYQLENNDSAIKFQAYEESDDRVSPFILVILTDLMKRVHLLVSLSFKIVG